MYDYVARHLIVRIPGGISLDEFLEMNAWLKRKEKLIRKVWKPCVENSWLCTYYPNGNIRYDLVSTKDIIGKIKE